MYVKHCLPVIDRLVVPVWLTPTGKLWLTDWSQLCVACEVFAPPGVYNFAHLPRDPKVIVDLGANCGLASKWFSMRYPTARVIAFEPNELACRTAVRNLPERSVSVRCAAAGAADGTIELWTRPGQSWGSSVLGSWGIQVTPSADHKVDPVASVSLDSMLDELGHIDLLKIDIEGAEYDVLRACSRIDDVGCIIGEFHPQAGIAAEDFFALLRRFDVERQSTGAEQLFIAVAPSRA